MASSYVPYASTQTPPPPNMLRSAENGPNHVVVSPPALQSDTTLHYQPGGPSPTAYAQLDQESPPKKRRKGRACERCHNLKVKCDKDSPSCSRCQEGGIACRYTTRLLVERKPKRTTNKQMENGFQRFEQMWEDVMERLAQMEKSIERFEQMGKGIMEKLEKLAQIQPDIKEEANPRQHSGTEQQFSYTSQLRASEKVETPVEDGPKLPSIPRGEHDDSTAGNTYFSKGTVVDWSTRDGHLPLGFGEYTCSTSGTRHISNSRYSNSQAQQQLEPQNIQQTTNAYNMADPVQSHDQTPFGQEFCFSAGNEQTRGSTSNIQQTSDAFSITGPPQNQDAHLLSRPTGAFSFMGVGDIRQSWGCQEWL